MVLSEVPSWPEPKSARGCLAYNPLETSTNHEIQMYSVLIPCVLLSSCFRCDGCYITLTANLIIYYCTWPESTSEVFRAYIMIYDFGSSKQKTSKNDMLVCSSQPFHVLAKQSAWQLHWRLHHHLTAKWPRLPQHAPTWHYLSQFMFHPLELSLEDS